MKTKITTRQKLILCAVAFSVLTVGVQIFSLLCLNTLITDDRLSKIYFALSFVCLALSKIPTAFQGWMQNRQKLPFIKNLSFAGAYAILAISAFVAPGNHVNFCIISAIYFLTVAANRICLCFEKRKISSYIFNGLLAFVSLIVAGLTFYLFTQETQISLAVLVCIIVIMIISLIDILIFTLSRIQLRGIVKIMKRTYVFEILYGLVVLIVASSFYFSITEEEVHNFGDGLWYSFSVITTIGFGDIKVTGFTSRVLSVIMGIYGLIVVAVFTSVIVNFYNETRDKNFEERLAKIEALERESKKAIQKEEKAVEELQNKEEEDKKESPDL